MFKVIENTMVVENDVMSGIMVVSNREEDSKVIFSGSDSIGSTIDEHEKMIIVLQNLPKEIKELKGETWSIRFEGENAISILLEMANLVLKLAKAASKLD